MPSARNKKDLTQKDLTQKDLTQNDLTQKDLTQKDLTQKDLTQKPPHLLQRGRKDERLKAVVVTVRWL